MAIWLGDPTFKGANTSILRGMGGAGGSSVLGLDEVFDFVTVKAGAARYIFDVETGNTEQQISAIETKLTNYDAMWSKDVHDDISWEIANHSLIIRKAVEKGFIVFYYEDTKKLVAFLEEDILD